MRLAIALTAAVLFLTSCGGEEPKSDAEPSSSKPSETTSAGLSDDCKVALLTWQRAADRAISDAAAEVPFGEPDDANEATDRITVYCAKGIVAKVAEANYELALLNSGLTICDTVPENCDVRENETQRGKADAAITEVKALAS